MSLVISTMKTQNGGNGRWSNGERNLEKYINAKFGQIENKLAHHIIMISILKQNVLNEFTNRFSIYM